jgi:tRNA pseudouridine55 synthase
VRSGQTPELAPRAVMITRLELLHWQPELGQLKLEVHCSAGTYIRSLARDLGEALGCGGALHSLRRTGALGFGLEQSVPLERLDPDQLAQTPLPGLIDPLQALGHLPRQRLSAEAMVGWRCGRPQACPPDWPGETAVVVVTPDGNLAGMARVAEPGQLQPRLVLDAAG